MLFVPHWPAQHWFASLHLLSSFTIYFPSECHPLCTKAPYPYDLHVFGLPQPRNLPVPLSLTQRYNPWWPQLLHLQRLLGTIASLNFMKNFVGFRKTTRKISAMIFFAILCCICFKRLRLLQRISNSTSLLFFRLENPKVGLFQGKIPIFKLLKVTSASKALLFYRNHRCSYQSCFVNCHCA